MRIGPFQLDNNLLLAPMAGITDRPFRQLCRSLGAGMAVSEMVSSNTALRGNPKTVRRLDFEGEPGPVSVQIVGSDPRMMAEAARINTGQGAQIVDINMGCPAKKVCNLAAGSALLRNEKLVAEILRAVVGAVDVPVTLKIRTGWEPASRNGVEIARIAEQEGVQLLAVHGRTRACRFGGQAEYQTIRRIKQSVSIPVLANGDIDSSGKAREVLEYTGADGIMIGRAAQGRPWIFREVAHYLKTGELLAAPTREWIGDLLAGHVERLYSFYGVYQGIRVARKHIAWYSSSQPGGALFRKKIYGIDSADEQIAMIRDFFTRPDEREALAA